MLNFIICEIGHASKVTLGKSFLKEFSRPGGNTDE